LSFGVRLSATKQNARRGQAATGAKQCWKSQCLIAEENLLVEGAG
jgi:hypothetical protein